MTNEKLVGLFGTISHLRDLHRQQEETMREMVFAVAGQHLKQNEVKQTSDDWQYTRAALEMLLGKRQFTPNVGGFALKQAWPTHLRVSDLKPVRVRWDRDSDYVEGVSDHVLVVRFLRSSKVEYGINQKMLDEQFLPLTDEEIK